MTVTKFTGNETPRTQAQREADYQNFLVGNGGTKIPTCTIGAVEIDYTEIGRLRREQEARRQMFSRLDY